MLCVSIGPSDTYKRPLALMGKVKNELFLRNSVVDVVMWLMMLLLLPEHLSVYPSAAMNLEKLKLFRHYYVMVSTYPSILLQFD